MIWRGAADGGDEEPDGGDETPDDEAGGLPATERSSSNPMIIKAVRMVGNLHWRRSETDAI